MRDRGQIGAQGVQVPHPVPIDRHWVTEFLAVARNEVRIDAGVVHIAGSALLACRINLSSMQVELPGPQTQADKNHEQFHRVGVLLMVNWCGVLEFIGSSTKALSLTSITALIRS